MPSLETSGREKCEEQIVHRCYVLKKDGFDPDADHLRRFVREELGAQASVRTGMRYDTAGITENEFKTAASTVFAEAPVNDLCDNEGFKEYIRGKTVILVELLPEQFDQMAESAVQCIELTTGKRPQCRIAKVIIVDGHLEHAQIGRLKEHLINKTDSREASLALPATLADELNREVRHSGPVDGFLRMDLAVMQDVCDALELKALSPEDIQEVQTYFRKKGRDPIVTELNIINTYWSDHCRHTTFTAALKKIFMGGRTLVENGVIQERDETALSPAGRTIRNAVQRYMEDRMNVHGENAPPASLMDLALLSMREARKKGLLDDVEESEENNAASIIVNVEFVDGRSEEWFFLFKNETHNHPTELEPYGGAATCMGGVIRDPLSGRVYPFVGMRISGSGDPRVPLTETMHGKLPQRRITTRAADGFSGYGNQIGIPTPYVREYYHPRYKAKRFEAGLVGGAAPRSHVRKEQPKPGDRVILLGGRTGRDGINGASGSSVSHTEQSVATCVAEVQKGNPVEERAIMRLFRDPGVTRKIVRCNDFGAGGVAVAVGELADGLDISLDDVPLKYRGMSDKDIAIAESQERMAVVVPAEEVEEFLEKAAAENLEATVIATVTDDRVLCMRHQGETVCELDRDFLNGGWAKREATVAISDPGDVACTYLRELPDEVDGDTLFERWMKNLRRLNVCSQHGLQMQFDSTVGANTVVAPYGGMYQASPSEAAVMKFPAEGALTKVALSASMDPELGCISPFHAGFYAVIDSIARLVASGASLEKVHLTIQNYFGKTSDPETWGIPFLAQLGAREAQRALRAAVGGKDSMSGTYTDTETEERMDVPPTLLSFGVATMDKSMSVIPSHFQKANSAVVHVPVALGEDGLPDTAALAAMWRNVHALMQEGVIRSCHAVRVGGIAAALTEMAVGNHIGVSLAGADDAFFTPQYGSILMEVSPQDVWKLAALSPRVLGRTTVEQTMELRGAAPMRLDLGTVQKAWQSPLQDIFPVEPPNACHPEEPALGASWLAARAPQHDTRGPRRVDTQRHYSSRVAQPLASVLTFPGTNCEIETAAAFERAGAKAHIQLFRNKTRTAVEDSLREMAAAIAVSQIVAIPGGFSAGDQPDGSAKYIANVLRNPRISDALMRHIGNGRLVLGICNGFQALVKSLLLPGGRIGIQDSKSATLTFNSLGRFISTHVQHRVTSVLSPWMKYVDIGELIDIPVAHGEGRLMNLPSSVWENGQVPLQYAGRDGVVRARFPNNINGSEGNAAAITDATGRVFGIMGHPERALNGLTSNIPTERKGQRIIDAGVAYFQ